MTNLQWSVITPRELSVSRVSHGVSWPWVSHGSHGCHTGSHGCHPSRQVTPRSKQHRNRIQGHQGSSQCPNPIQGRRAGTTALTAGNPVYSTRDTHFRGLSSAGLRAKAFVNQTRISDAGISSPQPVIMMNIFKCAQRKSHR